MDMRPVRSSPLRTGVVAVSLVLGALLTAPCATSPGPSPGPASDAGSENKAPLFELPEHWRIVDEQEKSGVYQANLKNRAGAGRILVGRMQLQQDEIRDLSVYLHKLNDSLVNRIRGRANLDPFAQDRLAWSNDMIGYRTKMRGNLGDRVVILEGITFSDGNYAYFHYGLFPEADYKEEREAYASLLASFRPLRDAERRSTRGMAIAQSDEAAAADKHRDGAESPSDYQSPKTHLGLAQWGTSRDAIVEQAGEPLRQGNRAIGYRCRFVGLDNCVVIYIFTFDQLTHGGFLIEDEFDDPQKYVSKYLRLTKTLTDRYGKPEQSSAIWNNPKYKNDGKQWGEALAQNHVVFGTVWEIGPAKVVHSLRKKDGEIDHRVVVTNEKLRKQLQKKVQAKK